MNEVDKEQEQPDQASPSLLGVRGAPDLNAMSRELTGAFIGYQWRLENPYPALYDKDSAERAYLHDRIFHNKVQQITCGVMQIVQKHL